mmetsp:Transcript_29039/g.68429  ORF Transcript_29039/g.68429 Transcript_29039/m.68429 type:complete len:97 (+) Transcript_29039:91-381(+)|eukprot:s1050_g4.t1
MAAVSGPFLSVPLAARPDDQLDTSEEPPIELIVTDVPPKQAEQPEDDFANLEYEKPKIEIQPVKKEDSKIKRKATGFVKDVPPEEDDERRRCCVLM